MKSFNWKSLVPHLIAVGVFLLVALIFCYPSLESNVTIVQGDMTGTQGNTHQSYEYLQAHGHFPLWTTNMFSGMPAFNIIFGGSYNPLGIIDSIFQLWLPKPINYFFLLCVGFYFLTVCLNIRSWVGIIMSLAYAYCSYDPIIAAVGHQTKILAMGYAPAVLGGIILIFEKKYISGFVFTALFLALHLLQNHTQISYYLLLVIVIMAIFYVVQWIRTGQFRHIGIVVSLGLVAALLGVLVNALTLLPTYDYSNDTKRGGQLVMDKRIDAKTNVVEANRTKGLSIEYAFQWSYGKAETFSLMIPGVMGYGLHYAKRDEDNEKIFPMLSENSHVAKYFTEKLGVAEEQAAGYAKQMSTDIYWGNQPNTAGPVYLGAIVCFLFIFGMVYLDDKHKWWILVSCLLAIFMALGKNLPGFNSFLFEHLPFYNKFRGPTLSLFIPQLLFPIIGALALNKLLVHQDEDAWKNLKIAAIVAGVLFAVAAAMYFSFDFAKENKQRTSAFNIAFATVSNDANTQATIDSLNQKYQPESDNQLYENFVFQTKGDKQLAKGVVTALRSDRAAIFGKDILRSLLFTLLTLVLMAGFIRKKISEKILLGGIGLLILIDLLSIGFNYLNKTNFISKDEYESNQFPASPADIEILKDKDPNYRVFNYAGGDPFQESRTSYFHKSIGGYHPAKLAIYDDLITYQLSGKLNEQVLNMLNTKYVIQNNPQTKQPIAIPNPGALGNCWFVKGVQYVDGAVAEMRALDAFKAGDTAVVDLKFKNDVGNISPADSASTIRQTAFDNEAITYQSSATATHLAIFSEIYYKDWVATIDGTPAKIIKADYVLRGLAIPAGKHTIQFTFQPKAYKIGNTLTSITSWLLFLLVLAFLARELFFRKV